VSFELPEGPVLIVSPHADDAALSCAALLDRGEPVEVVTVCLGEPDPPQQGWWDEVCGFASSAESIPARRREDEAALGPGGHRRRFLDLLEGQYLDGARRDEDARHVSAAVGDWLATNPGGAVALPAGAGWAPRWVPLGLARQLRQPRGPEPNDDHAFVRDVVLRQVDGARFILYEEFPYLWGGPGERAARRAAEAHGYRANVHEEQIDRTSKARRMSAYASQVAHLWPSAGRLDRPEILPETERYWLLARD
jgi:GlcNAc-PI de-N-acetylase